MQQIVDVISQIGDRIIWGPPMIIAILSFGVYMTARTGFFQITRIRLIIKETVFSLFKNKADKKANDNKAISQFQAISTALAATIGTGNIAGVASAITVGGPGAVFWMWVSAFFGMMTAFSENVLGIYYRKRNSLGEWSGGAMYYLKNGLKGKKHFNKLAEVLATLFAMFCVLASFGMGNMAQINTVAGVLKHSLKPVFGISVSPLITGIASAVLLAVIMIGGVSRIGSITERLVPFMAGAYILGTTIIFILNISSVGGVFGAIFKGAFGLNAVAGGFFGSAVKQAVALGFRRGVFSNEAGLGSSVIVHSAADVKEPVIQGMWGIFTVFFDTIVGCSLTAFAILSSGVVDLKSGASLIGVEGAELVAAAFSGTLHEYAGAFIAISTVFFAISTVIGWSFYGQKAVEYLFGESAVLLYRLIFALVAVVGAVVELNLVWKISDIFNGLMAVPNLIGITVLSNQVLKITDNYIQRRLKNKSYLSPLYSYDAKIQKEFEESI